MPRTFKIVATLGPIQVPLTFEITEVSAAAPALDPVPVVGPAPATEPMPTAPAPDIAPAPVVPDKTPAVDPTPVVPATTATAPSTAPKIQIGMNLGGIANYSAEYPFIDYMKTAGAPSDGWTGPLATNLRDVNGWANTMPPSGNQINYAIAVAAGSYDLVLLYDGSPAVGAYDPQAGVGNTLGWNAMSATSITPGRIVFHTDAGGSVNLSINHLDAANPMRNIRLMRASDEAAFRAGEIFNPYFVTFIKAFGRLRTMDWSCTNGSTLAHWADRPKVTDAAWSCVPIEVQVALANTAGSDLWLNIPAMADDDYIRQIAMLVCDTLAPGLKLHLEYSNEVWNGQFTQNAYAQAQGKALGADLGGLNAQRWYGFRAAQMMRIAKDVLGSRVSGVYAAFTAYTDAAINGTIDAGITLANVGAAADLFDEYAVTTYFGDQLSLAPTPDSDANRATIMKWAAANDLDATFNELEHGGGLQGDFSLDRVRQFYAFHAVQAKARGLKLVAYEGGLSGYWFNTTPAEQAIVLPFLQRLVADPRMGVLYTRMATDFAAAGGVELTHFNDVGGVSIWGPWGATTALGVTTPRLKALLDLSGR